MSQTAANMGGDDKRNKVFDQNNSDYLFSQLPKSKGFFSDNGLYQDFWCPKNIFHGVNTFLSQFEPHDDDIFVASLPKSGTTWLKAIAFSVMTRSRYSISDSPLLTANPHELVPFVEFVGSGYLPTTHVAQTTGAEPITAGGGRLRATHLPYGSLADSVKRSPCRVLYVCRNPLDVVVSTWHFNIKERWTLEELVDRFCDGAQNFGPYWKHVLGYWKESLERPEKVLFLKYEEMKRDTVAQVKRIAEFLGYGFSEEEVARGVVEEIVELCSLKSLKNLEVNKKGEVAPSFKNEIFFRKGEVGDWVNYLTPSMAQRINEVVEEKLRGSGLTFKTSI